MRALKKALLSGDRHEPAGDERLRAEWERVRQVVAVRGAPAKAPAFVAPDGAPALDAAVELLRQTRQALIENVGGTTYEQLLCITLLHPFETVGLLTGAGWLSFIAAHEERHTRQIEALLY